jgi:hypothetical protein
MTGKGDRGEELGGATRGDRWPRSPYHSAHTSGQDSEVEQQKRRPGESLVTPAGTALARQDPVGHAERELDHPPSQQQLDVQRPKP